ncbi:unnamed protein product [Prorocentrum cordatum]|uniref:Phosphodiesterase n=1 Tax=Prorocentrum cordatum TaxID=2364126 RepID=A0ABN9SZW1_9DINO|nr:unnamed protein product [Polarella glacialis]
MGNAHTGVVSCHTVAHHEGATESFVELAPESPSGLGGAADRPERTVSRMMTHAMTHRVATGAEGDLDSTGYSLADLVTALEACTTMTVAKYRAVLKSSGDSEEALPEVKRCEEALKRVEKQLKAAQRLQERQVGQGGEADTWLHMYTGGRRRVKSLKAIATRVQMENSIIRHWRKQKGNSYGQAQIAQGIEKMPIDQWSGVDVFELERENQQPLTTVFMTIWKRRGLDQLCKTPEEKVFEFIRSMELEYKSNPYHNRIHAAEVTLTAYYLWSQLAAQQGWQDYFVGVDLLVLLLAAAVHDVGHPAVNNDFMIKTRDDLTLRYNDRSVLENYHAATAFRAMRDRGINLLEHNLPSPPPGALRTRVIDMVLATDMEVHKQTVGALHSEVQDNARVQDINKLVLEKNVLHMSDIGHPLRPKDQHREWSRRCTEEFFAQGDREKSLGLQPMQLFDRELAPPLAKGQLGFLNFVVMPTWKAMRLVLGDEGAATLDKCLKDNVSSWEAEAARWSEDQSARLAVAEPMGHKARDGIAEGKQKQSHGLERPNTWTLDRRDDGRPHRAACTTSSPSPPPPPPGAPDPRARRSSAPRAPPAARQPGCQKSTWPPAIRTVDRSGQPHSALLRIPRHSSALLGFC